MSAVEALNKLIFSQAYNFYFKYRHISRVLFHLSQSQDINYHLSIRPTRYGFLAEKSGTLVPQLIWSFNTQGLPNTFITEGACRLLPYIFTITPRFNSGLPCLCGTVCYINFRLMHPYFHMVSFPALPGLSSRSLTPRR